MAGVTGASRAVAFDHNVRSAPLAERGERGAQGPLRYAHHDYTERSAPQRVRDLLLQEADRLLTGHFAIVNFWKPIRGPVEKAPLTFCDAQTLTPEDFVATDLLYEDRAGEVYSLSYRPEHRWFYYPGMKAQEVGLLKCYDS